jgi:hypothetical protein
MRHVGLSLSAAFMLFVVTANVAIADPTPVPSPAAGGAAQPAAAPPSLPKDFDPCGGPLELLNKIGTGTACVFVRGEAALSAQYASANVPVNTQIDFNGNTFNLTGAAHAFGYPAPVVYIGVLPRAQLVITPPSFVQVNAGNLGTVAAGASDMKFEYKQLAYLDPEKFTMVALDLAYKAPTGSQALRGPGPEYTFDPIITQPLHHNLGLTIAIPINNFTVSCATCSSTSRGWSVSPQFIPYWTSPGGTLLSLFIQHNFNPSTTPVAFSAAQLLGRHLDIVVTEGGFTRTSSSSGPFFGLVNTSSTAYPSVFSVSVNYLFGHSDLPAALQQ